MARFLHWARRALLSSGSSCPRKILVRPPSPTSSLSSPFRHTHRLMSHIADMRKSAFRENLLRILRTEIEYELEMRPPREPVKEFNSFMVEERPGEQYIRLTRNYGDKEDIKVDVTMFDGFASTSPDARTDDPGGDVKLHISLIVDVLKSESFNGVLQFICSAWPDTLVIQKVFLYRRDPAPLRPFMGPDFKELDDELQEALMSYLGERGIDDDLAAFLHDYMASKDVSEHVRWMGNVKAYIEK